MNFSDFGYLRVAACSTAISIANPEHNARSILDTARALADEGVSLAVFPELCLSGYSAEDLFFSDTLLTESRTALARLVSANPLPGLAVGLPWRLADGRLLNCAAMISGNRLLGMVPKVTHPNHGEFYDLRWFVSGRQVNETLITDDLGQFQLRTDQLFHIGDALVGMEICEDLWSPEPPSAAACLAGAEIMLNLSASNELIAKADYRRDLVRMNSASNLCAYAYASAGAGESTKDVVYGGHCLVAENGQVLSESERFSRSTAYTVADVDLHWLRHDRRVNTSFAGHPRPTYRHVPASVDTPALPELRRNLTRQPFVPEDEHEFSARAQEILSIQSHGLARRLDAIGTDRLVIGLSGGLDSTLAFLVCLDTLALVGAQPDTLHALTMPGPGTTELTLGNARALVAASGAHLEEIDIVPAVEQHLADLKHAGEHNVVFENAQARERTQILFNYANKVSGVVVGTGDLSELALGWCTYNADHMAGYNVNASVPKTLMAYLVRWYAVHRAEPELADVLRSVLDTPISPELLPPEAGQIAQQTEAIVGPYELHDFFLFHFLRYGSDPTKIHALAERCFAEQYDSATIAHWLAVFFRRFFTQQFKRTTLPPGPKVGSVSLSPRGDWRMPDEASAERFLQRVDKLHADHQNARK